MARTRSSSGRGRSRFGRNVAQIGAVEFFTRPEQSIVWQVLGFIVRVRAELTIITALVVVALVGQAQIGPDAAFILMAATTVVVFAVPASRRFMVRRSWCVTTRHRMRACFAQTRTMTHDGRMPFLWWSRPSPVGERVRVWLPAGLSVNDLQRVTAELAAACWARDVRVHGSRSQAAFVMVDVIRRDPLASSTILTPDVIHDIDTVDDTDGTVVPLPDRAALRSAPTPDPQPATAGGPRSTRKIPATVPARTNTSSTANSNGGTSDDSDDSVTGFGGVDVSDYV